MLLPSGRKKDMPEKFNNLLWWTKRQRQWLTETGKNMDYLSKSDTHFQDYDVPLSAPSIAIRVTVDLISEIFLRCHFIVSFNSSTLAWFSFTNISYAVFTSKTSNIPASWLSSLITSVFRSRSQLIST